MSYQLTLVQSKVRLDIMQSNGSYAAAVGNTAMSLNAWHHVAGVYDGRQMRVEFDGQTTNDSSASGANGTLQGGTTYSTDVPTGGGSQLPIAVANGPYNAQVGQA